MPRRAPDSDRTALWGSAAVHAAAVVLAFASTAFEPEPLVFQAIQIDLVSPPASVQAEVAEPAPPEERLEVETPDPAPRQPEPEPVAPREARSEEKPKPVEAKAEPKPAETKPAETKPAETKPAETRPAENKPAATDPKPTDVSGEDIEVRMEGLKKDYPAYYDNIIRQMTRCFRPPQGATGETTVDFYVRRDGTVADVKIFRRSGSIDLDLESVAAVTCAGEGGRLGALPEDLPYDRLPIRFKFSPRGRTPDPT